MPTVAVPEATWLADTPPAELKSPPAYKVVPLTARVYTTLSTPLPRGLQLLPSQAATRFAGRSSAVVKSPPA